MRIVIAGGHGKIALLLERILADAGHTVTGIVRAAGQAPDLELAGASVALLDLEKTGVDALIDVVSGADAVVFAAGGGPDGNADRKQTVDLGAAVLLADAAQVAGVRRYLMVSAMGTDRADPHSDEVFDIYLRAKQAADDDLRARDLDWTVVKPGLLTDDGPTGRVAVGTLDRGAVTRGDVAAVLAACLTADNTIGRTFDLLNGSTPIPQAVAGL